jgi:protein-disulfide isomerase
MKRTHGWLVVLVAAALLAAACGPEMATPTPGATEASVSTAPAVPTQSTQPTQPAVSAGLPVDPADWHVLGSADAPVTIIEYSDFQ